MGGTWTFITHWSSAPHPWVSWLHWALRWDDDTLGQLHKSELWVWENWLYIHLALWPTTHTHTHWCLIVFFGGPVLEAKAKQDLSGSALLCMGAAGTAITTVKTTIITTTPGVQLTTQAQDSHTVHNYGDLLTSKRKRRSSRDNVRPSFLKSYHCFSCSLWSHTVLLEPSALHPPLLQCLWKDNKHANMWTIILKTGKV